MKKFASFIIVALVALWGGVPVAMAEPQSDVAEQTEINKMDKILEELEGLIEDIPARRSVRQSFGAGGEYNLDDEFNDDHKRGHKKEKKEKKEHGKHKNKQVKHHGKHYNDNDDHKHSHKKRKNKKEQENNDPAESLRLPAQAGSHSPRPPRLGEVGWSSGEAGEAGEDGDEIFTLSRDQLLASAVISSGYYIRPIVGGRRSQGLHGRNAVDLAAPSGTPILAAAAGTVVFSGRSGGYGNLIVIEHNNGTKTAYAHNSKNLVKQGDVVEQGEIIGRVGSTGKSTGPHLHFEVRGAKNPF